MGQNVGRLSAEWWVERRCGAKLGGWADGRLGALMGGWVSGWADNQISTWVENQRGSWMGEWETAGSMQMTADEMRRRKGRGAVEVMGG